MLSSGDFTSLHPESKKIAVSKKILRIVLPVRYLALNDFDLLAWGTEMLNLPYYDVYDRGDKQMFLSLLRTSDSSHSAPSVPSIAGAFSFADPSPCSDWFRTGQGHSVR